MAQIRDSAVKLTFSNYNYAFSNFFEQYKSLCLTLSEKTLLHEIPEIKRLISSFIYEYDYTIQDKGVRFGYRDRIKELNHKLDTDDDAKQILLLDKSIVQNRLQYHQTYYHYLIKYLELMGNFALELTSTYMPHTNVQVKLIRFWKSQVFFEKFILHKKTIMEALSTFTVREFNQCFNKLLIFYYAYSLFINNEDKVDIDRIFSLVLSIYLSEDVFRLLNARQLSSLQVGQLSTISEVIHNALLLCNSRMNTNFSNYDVLPKIEYKTSVDRTLI